MVKVGMTIVYIEPVPKSREKGTPIDSYSVETRANEKLKMFDTQDEAIHWAQMEGYTVNVARVRNTSKSNPDHWRKAG